MKNSDVGVFLRGHRVKACKKLYSGVRTLYSGVRPHQLQGGHMGSTRYTVGPLGDLTWDANRVGPCKIRVHSRSRRTQQVQRLN